MEAGGRGVGEAREFEFLALGGSILCGREEEEDGGDKGEEEERYFRDGAESSPRLSKSIPSLITIVSPASNTCSKLMSLRELRLRLVSARLPLRSPRDAFGWSPDGKDDGGTSERGEEAGLRNMDPRVATDDDRGIRRKLKEREKRRDRR
jgi:hypothetical protein